MPQLRVSVLGPLIISLDDQPIYSFRTNTVQALLIYLLLERERVHRREDLITLLWPDIPPETARINLRQTIYRLQEAISAVDAKRDEKRVPLVQSDRQGIRINPDADILLDVNEFEVHLEKNPEQAVLLYRGDFLADLNFVDSINFNVWTEQFRQKFQLKVLATLSNLTEQYLESENFKKAQQFAWRQLEINKLEERAYRQLMIALADSGQCSAALSQFNLCQRRLEEELGLKPSEATIELYEKIQRKALTRIQERGSENNRRQDQEMPIFLLTDIEDSTRLWDQYHEAMLSALFTHNRILEDKISKHGGRILELRGDGVKAVFEGGDPLGSVIDIQKEIKNTDWVDIGNLRIRIGLHGLPEVRKGYDYFKEEDKYYGPVLNHTARIMDAGWGGQILVSEQVYNTRSLPDGARWVDHGLHALKSLDQPVRIFELTHPELGALIFPPLKTLSNPPGQENDHAQNQFKNIPPQLTPFLGRSKELKRLKEFITKPDAHLVTIIGAGGMGKTRLAIATAESLAKVENNRSVYDLFADGVYFIPLTPLDHPDQIIPTIINNVNIPIETHQKTDRVSQIGTDLKEKMLNFLQSKKMLVILDNFEHLLDGAGLISDIISFCPTLRIIITSRERLHLREEQVFPIHGLEYPPLEYPDNFLDFAAVELFIQSAQRNKPDFSIDVQDIPHLMRICNLIGGMPLGLELAAAWVDLLSLKEIAEEIQKNIDFLETDIRNIPKRHRSIRAVFDSSCQYLTSKERQVFPRFSVFRGRFDRKAAELVAGASIWELATFVNKSLLQYNESEGCYQIHELLRQYGEEHLKASPIEEKKTRDKFSQHYCSTVKEVIDASLMSGDLLAFHHIKNDLSNIVEAWNWSVEQRQVENIDHVVDGLCLYYDWNFQAKEGLTLCQLAIEMLTAKINQKEEIPENDQRSDFVKRVLLKVYAYKALFNLYFDSNESQRVLIDSLSIIKTLEARKVPLIFEKMLIHYLLGVVYYQLGDISTSKEYFVESFTLSQQINHEFLGLRNLDALGDIARSLGMPRESKDWYEKSLIKARVNHNRWGELRALNNLGWAARSIMDYTRAIEIYEENLTLAHQYKNPFEIIRVLESIGFLALFLGNFTEAISHFSRAVSISSDFGIQRQALGGNTHIAIAHWLAGNFQDAEPVVDAVISLSQKVTPNAQIFPGVARAEYMIIAGRYREARDQLHITQELANQFYTDRFFTGRLARTIGWLKLAEKDYPRAEAQFKASIDIYHSITDDEQVSWSQAGLARAYLGQGFADKAREELTDALWTVVEMKAFIPLLFILPVAALLLAQENLKLADEVYHHTQSSPFLSKSQFMRDVIWDYLPLDIKAYPSTIRMDEKKQKEILWEVGSSVLTYWMKFWMEGTEHSEIKRLPDNSLG